MDKGREEEEADARKAKGEDGSIAYILKASLNSNSKEREKIGRSTLCLKENSVSVTKEGQIQMVNILKKE